VAFGTATGGGRFAGWGARRRRRGPAGHESCRRWPGARQDPELTSAGHRACGCAAGRPPPSSRGARGVTPA